MNRIFLLAIIISFSSFGQVQIGNTIYGNIGRSEDESGTSVSTSGNGNIVAIGSPKNSGESDTLVYRGHVRVFENIDNAWIQVGNDIEGKNGDYLGTSISLSFDGNIIATGGIGHVRIYENIGAIWSQLGDDIDEEAWGDGFGNSISLSSDGSIVAIGALKNDDNGEDSGHVRIYEIINNVWTKIGSDIDGEAAGNLFGYSVSLSSDGSVVAIGAPKNEDNGEESGHVRIYQDIGGIWTQIGNDIDGEAEDDFSGNSVSLSANGNIVAIGALNNDGKGGGSGHVRIYENIGGIWTQIGNDIDGDGGGGSGDSVSLSSNGSIVAISARVYSENGNSSNTGNVRVYENIGGNWIQLGNDIYGEARFDFSGDSISLSSDGSIIAIGAKFNDGNGAQSGHVRVYKNINGVWTQLGNDIDGKYGFNANRFGNSVSLSSDGKIFAAGARSNDSNGISSGRVRVYENIGGIWTQLGNDINGEAEYDNLGDSVSLSSDGSIIAIGAGGHDGINGENSGHVRIYENIGGIWTQIGSDIEGEGSGDKSGTSVSLSSDGSIVAIGAKFNDGINGNNSGHVRVYENINNIWSQLGNDINGEAEYDRFGTSVSLSANGSIIAIGAENNDGNGRDSGHTRVFENISGVWTQIGNDIDGEDSRDGSGGDVSLSSDGTIVAIGAKFNRDNGSSSGHVRIYENIGGNWNQIGSDIDGEAASDESGNSVSLSSNGSIVAIGAPQNRENLFWSGHVRIYKNISGVWTQVGTDIDGKESYSLSGSSVSLSSDGSKIVIGAIGNGINGIHSGQVSVYDLSAVLSTKSLEKDFFTYYPNPVKDVLNINLNKGLELKQINIYNLQSQYLYSVKTSKINVSDLSSGLYFIEVVTNEGKSAKKIIIN